MRTPKTLERQQSWLITSVRWLPCWRSAGAQCDGAVARRAVLTCLQLSEPVHLANPAGGALVPEMMEQRHAEFLADAQQFLLRNGQVGGMV